MAKKCLAPLVVAPALGDAAPVLVVIADLGAHVVVIGGAPFVAVGGADAGTAGAGAGAVPD